MAERKKASHVARRRGRVRATAVLGFLLVAAAAMTTLACADRGAAGQDGPRVIILGFDGMDFEFTQRLMEEGALPNFSRLAASGFARPLGTSVPPLSPVAWSTFITGMDPGGHGIFDFIHRDPETLFPYFSTSEPEDAGRLIELGEWQLPLGGGGYRSLRYGQPFWEVLEEHGIETSVLRMPANFPPSGTASYELSGMGTPDLLGTYGTFSFYSSDIFLDERDVAGGAIYPLDLWSGVAEGTLHGPDHPYRSERTPLELDFTLYVDELEPVAKLEVGDEERVLMAGEWSDWVPVEFELLPLMNLHGMARFYLRQVRPEVELYVSPINFDPLYGQLPISTPDDYAEELAKATGRFYTQGMPEDTQALKGKVLTPAEFLEQARIAGEEVERQYDYVFDSSASGLLFYYFGNTDLVSHMVWHAMDEEHPAFDEERWGPHREAVREVYASADRIVGRTLDAIGPETTLLVMSDHGFASWRRTLSLNAWLRDNGYLVMKNRQKREGTLLADVDWSRTRAYGYGLNGLYVNLAGREKNGIVDPADKDRLLDEIGRELLATVDPATGEPAVTKVYPTARYFEHHDHLDVGPDMVIGYAEGTRGESDSALGEIAAEAFSDNVDDWGADHGMDHETVPGILFANRELGREAHSLQDLAAAVLAEFGVEQFPVAADQP